MRCKIIHPAVPDDRIRKQGGYRIKPDGTKTFSWGSVKKTPIWLGYANGVPHLPFPWEDDTNQTQLNVSGLWATEFGDLSLVQEGTRVSGKYPNDNGVITGVLKDNIFEGYWIEDKANKRCPNYLQGRYYWGKVRFVFDGNRFNGDFGYCREALSGRSWNGTLKNAATAAGTTTETPTPKTAAKPTDEAWRSLPDFEFKTIED